jgi:hypothetical protein
MSEGQTVESNSATMEAPAVGTPDQAAAPVTGTPEGQNGQATTQAQSAPAEENFSSIDPKTLPPELQALHKSLQADYTRKTQAAAERLKQVDALEKKAKAYDQLSTDQRFKEYWTGLNRQEKAEFKAEKAKAEEALGKKISDDEFAKAFESKDSFLDLLKRVVNETRTDDQRRIQELEQKLTVSEAQDVIESFATEVGQDGKPARPDFYELDDPKYNLISGFLRVNPPENQSPDGYRARLDEAYQWAKAMTQDFYNKGKSEALSIIQKKAAASSEVPTQAAKNVYSGPDPKKLTSHEAVELAKKRIRIPQVYD